MFIILDYNKKFIKVLSLIGILSDYVTKTDNVKINKLELKKIKLESRVKEYSQELENIII